MSKTRLTLRLALTGLLLGACLLPGLSAARAEIPGPVLAELGLAPERIADQGAADLQRALQWTGHYRGPLDGTAGQATRRAIRAFQRGMGAPETGQLTPRERDLLLARAGATRAEVALTPQQSDWNGIAMLIPEGLVGEPRSAASEPLHINYPGRAAVQFAIQQMRWTGAGASNLTARELARLLVARNKGAEVLAAGTTGGHHYIRLKAGDYLHYAVFAHQRGETRGVSAVIAGGGNAFALQPVLAEILGSADLFAGPGVTPDQARIRLEAGEGPGQKGLPAWFHSMKANGSGSLVSTGGHVLTNHHVVMDCDRLTVNGFAADLVGADVRADLALVQVPQLSGREPVALRPTPARLGEDLLVLGYPVFSLTQALNVTQGIVSSTVGMEGSRISFQTTAPVQPGNSGGPVLDRSGQQIGVVSSKVGRQLREEAGVENIAWVVRADVALQFMKRYDIRPREGSATTPAGSTEALVRRGRETTLRVECH